MRSVELFSWAAHHNPVFLNFHVLPDPQQIMASLGFVARQTETQDLPEHDGHGHNIVTHVVKAMVGSSTYSCEHAGSVGTHGTSENRTPKCT